VILLLGGTREGREIAGLLAQEGYPLIVSVANRYGRELLPANIACREGRLNQEQLDAFLREKQIRLLIDATHPFAAEVSQNAVCACQTCGVQYLRFERESTPLPDSPLIHPVDDFVQAARLALGLGKRIFLTIGSKNLAVFVEEAKQRQALVFARVLPLPAVIAACSHLLPPAQIIALQGPYSRAFNQALFHEYRAEVVVAKESGAEGGTPAKIEAAQALGLPLVIIKRPVIDYPHQVGSCQELLTTIAQM